VSSNRDHSYDKDALHKYMETKRVERKRADQALQLERATAESLVRHNVDELVKKQKSASRSGSRSECTTGSEGRSRSSGGAGSRERDNVSSGSSTLDADSDLVATRPGPGQHSARPSTGGTHPHTDIATPTLARPDRLAERWATVRTEAWSLSSKITQQTKSIKLNNNVSTTGELIM